MNVWRAQAEIMDMEDVVGKQDTLCGVACCMGVVTSPE